MRKERDRGSEGDGERWAGEGGKRRSEEGPEKEEQCGILRAISNFVKMCKTLFFFPQHWPVPCTMYTSLLIFLYHLSELHTSVISGTASGRTDTMNSRDVLLEVKKTDPIVGCMSEAAEDPVGAKKL